MFSPIATNSQRFSSAEKRMTRVRRRAQIPSDKSLEPTPHGVSPSSGAAALDIVDAGLVAHRPYEV
jgi:hypothetical protein